MTAKYALRTLLCLVVIIWVVKSRIRCLANDESSMLALRDGITTNTMLSENWTQEAPFCSWIGVTCSRRHLFRVTALNLSYMGLQGNIPQEIGNLSFLSYLNIRDNSFSGPIPNTIGNLGRLRELLMDNNELSGPIPPSLFNISSLKQIQLSNNTLMGTIPFGMFNLSSLQLINLGSNQLSGTVTFEDICHHLPKLQVLSLRENQLVGKMSSSSLWECMELEKLALDYNNFSGGIPMQIGNFSRLQILRLGGNRLTGIIPATIGNFSKLENLQLGGNSFHGRVPSQIGQLFNLDWLSLGTCNLNGELPVSIYNLTKLRILSVEQNEVSGELPSSIDTGLPNLEQLYMGKNRFSGEIPRSISNLSHLSLLDLVTNSFRGQIPVNIGHLPNLEFLSFSYNQFANNLSIPDQDFLTPLANCKYLKYIAFSDNSKITGELPVSFFSYGNLSITLQDFVASSCGISGKIPIEISNLTSLILFQIGRNRLVGEIPDSFQKLVKIQMLVLPDNQLQGSIPHSICNMTALYYLILSMNNLSGQLPSCLGTDLHELREIYLYQNFFTSNIPLSLWSNIEIQKIYLDNNFFNGTLSIEIGNLKNLLVLHISGNQLSGNIPDSFAQLQNLNILSLSNNMLNGSIPESLSNLNGLEYLDLSHNSLSGPVPKSLENLAYLESLNVSFNQLSGEIPNEGPFRNFTAECFISNKNLCGAARFKVKPCKFIHPQPSHKRKIISRYILPPALTFLAFVAAIIIFFIYRHRNSSHASHVFSDFPRLLHERISYNDIIRATRNFDEDNLIGRGGFGSVYKGEFSDNVVAAVKVFNLDIQGALKSFDAECEILRSIRHRNLVKVMTCCSNLDFKALVMEYMANGNLDRWLHSREYSLNICQRFGIIVDVAVALEYLHHGNSTHIIHCDLKPSNILLDNDMVAHVSDFGISKSLTTDETTKQTKTLGTFGYMAPEYGSMGFVSTAADVYSYGIVVMETFTRKNPTSEMFSEEFTMKKWVSESFPNSLTDIIDDELLNTSGEDDRDRYERCLTSTFELALECTAEEPEERPSMNEVAAKIKKIMINLQVM